SPHDADDLVQETFVRVHAGLPALRDATRLGAWLAAIAANVLADHGRGRALNVVSLDADRSLDALPDARPANGADTDLRAVVAGWIEDFLGRLEPDDAALLRAVELDGRAQVDVARELGLAPSG